MTQWARYYPPSRDEEMEDREVIEFSNVTLILVPDLFWFPHLNFQPHVTATPQNDEAQI